jgi:hypothetical protein
MLLQQTALAIGMKSLFQQLEQRLALNQALVVYLAGGMAVNLYTASRVTSDIDAEFPPRIFIPSDLIENITLEDGSQQIIYFDTNYNPAFALMHEDYQIDAIPIDFGLEYMSVRVLAPVDLAVSKIARFADNDREDIQALVRLGLTNANEIDRRATEALSGYIGGQQPMLICNIKDAVALAKNVAAVKL